MSQRRRGSANKRRTMSRRREIDAMSSHARRADSLIHAVAAALVRVRRLGAQDDPFVSLGTGSGMRHEGVDVANATALRIAAGGTGIDTAYIYRTRENWAGIAAAGVDPSSLWLTTKIPCSSTAAAKKNIEADLQQLGVDSVDLILPHFPEESHVGCAGGSTADTWKALEAALAAGQTRQIGVSNFVVSDLEKLQLTAKSWPPALNQNSLSVGYHDDDTIAYCKKEGITYMAYSPLCGGPNGSSCRHGSVLSVPEVQAVAATHNVSAAQVASSGSCSAATCWRRRCGTPSTWRRTSTSGRGRPLR